ncbi:EAL domain-containing protein [Aliiglaciecola sp. NS0011-25]|uniref:putative bifunctional diguanylate cyclase/phosphodiesterase n=1 Tax=Aliiglaciecola sp. NS0011-25 TaxID=3127654 RepID=UPI003341BB8A
MYSNGYAGIVISLVASSLLVFGFTNAEIQTFKIYWWVSMVGLLLIRLADTFFWLKKNKTTEMDGKRSILRFSVGTIATATMWCVYCLILFPYIDTIELAFNIIIVSAMAGGASTVLAGSKATAMLYSAILLIPFSIALLLEPQFHEYILGILGLSFGFIMLLTANKSADFTTLAIRLKNDNATLVEHMEAEVTARTHQIYELSNIDPLTGLFNRSAFLNHLRADLKSSIKAEKPMALLFIDLDGFKKINDTIGHETGDKVLKQTADRLKEHYKNHQLICRWGGDEFLIALENTNQSEAIVIADNLIKHISAPYIFFKNRLSISATIGIAMYPEHATNEQVLIQLADTAMYYQKKAFPSTAGVFSAHLGKQLAREQRLKDALSEAIENQQLRLVFQPIVDSETFQPVAFEALLRWQLVNESIPPYEFISIAEQYGQIRKIGAWVLCEACKAAKSWQTQKALSVAVNVSVIQLQDNDFIEIVDNALSETGLPAKYLHIEITESVFAADKETLLDKIAGLQNRGIKVSIDDFGTEYSSLSVIQELSADKVKIDQAFVASLDTNGMPIVNAVLQIAKAFGYDVVAEGVESLQQAEILRKAGVNHLQGFYFAKPLETSMLKKYLKGLALPLID